jgi:hypothetical protein
MRSRNPDRRSADGSTLIARAPFGHGKQIVDVQAWVSEMCFMVCLRFSPYQSDMDRRATQRRPVRKAGMIEFPGGAFSCMVQNLSDVGAALDVPHSVGIPEQFTLMIIERGDAVQCRTVWRTERQIGVAFEAAS